MDKQTLNTLGTLILVAGLAVCSVGAYKIVTNLPVSDADAMQGPDGALSARDPGDAPGHASLQRDVELQVRKSALKIRNKDRSEKRGEGIGWLVSGMIVLIWGATMLLNSRDTPSEP